MWVPVYAFWLGWGFSGTYRAIQIGVTDLMHKRRQGSLGWFSTSRKTGMPGVFSERRFSVAEVHVLLEGSGLRWACSADCGRGKAPVRTGVRVHTGSAV